jgi:CheY-like chemotaxis protein
MVARILLVEDSDSREAFFRKNTPSDIHLVWAKSGGAALAILARDASDTYAGIMMDFDLGDQQLTETDKHTNGGVVVHRIISLVDNDTPVLVHSMNPGGAVAMVGLLTGHGFPVSRVPYSILTKERYAAWLECVRERAAELSDAPHPPPLLQRRA